MKSREDTIIISNPTKELVAFIENALDRKKKRMEQIIEATFGKDRP